MGNSGKFFKLVGIGTCVYAVSEFMAAAGEAKTIARLHLKDSAKAEELLADLDGKTDVKSKFIRNSARELIEKQNKEKK